jgi:hypothetical protein
MFRRVYTHGKGFAVFCDAFTVLYLYAAKSVSAVVKATRGVDY